MNRIIRVKTLFEYRVTKLLITLTLVGFASTAIAAGNPVTGKFKAISCQVCHGKGGHSTNPIYPNLAGQHAAYIEKQMHDFKTKKRIDPVMNEMATSMSDQDIADIAAYFQNVK